MKYDHGEALASKAESVVRRNDRKKVLIKVKESECRCVLPQKA